VPWASSLQQNCTFAIKTTSFKFKISSEKQVVSIANQRRSLESITTSNFVKLTFNTSLVALVKHDRILTNEKCQYIKTDNKLT